MNKLVCVVGMPGSGKSVVSDYFAEKGYQFVRFGQLTLDEVKKRGLTPTEANERKIRERLRRQHGMEAFAKLLLPKFKRLLKKGNVVGDGLYSWAEYKFLKERLGENLIIIAVYAPPQLRYRRISKRIMPNSDKNLRNRPFTKKEAKARDFAEIENLDKGGPIAMADYTILNVGDINYLIKQVMDLYELINS